MINHLDAAIAAEHAAVEDARAACAKLTPKERDILVLLCKGVPRKEIGEHVNSASSTVYTQFKEIFRKFEVRSAVEAAVIATKAGLV